MTHRWTAIAAAAAVAGLGACQNAEPEKAASPVDAKTVASASTEVDLTSYTCKSGAVVQAQYPTEDKATVKYKDKTYALNSAVSASGARYVGEGLEWWTANRDGKDTGTLSRDGAQSVILEECAAG